mmetsp:Transcript_17685/g.31698  ORF Transcript_17685/g.31698 Transcript_17685/m.31698 type:complete len:109 (+) Transcript_17685:142-468(+)
MYTTRTIQKYQSLKTLLTLRRHILPDVASTPPSFTNICLDVASSPRRFLLIRSSLSRSRWDCIVAICNKATTSSDAFDRMAYSKAFIPSSSSTSDAASESESKARTAS